MSPELTELLKNRQSPFNGRTVYTHDWTIKNVRDALLSFFYAVRRENENEFWINHDWWAHDKFILEQSKIKFDTVMEHLESDKSFMNSCDKDFAVSIAIYPLDYSWLVRYNIDENYEWDVEREFADFDISMISFPKLAFLEQMHIEETIEFLRMIAGDDEFSL